MSANAYRFGGKDVLWEAFMTYEGFDVALLNIDEAHRTIDFLFRFQPDRRCMFHRHIAPTRSLVIEGEHHIFECQPDGAREHRVNPAGTWSQNDAPEIHIEGGGPDGAVVFMSVRAEGDHIYDLLDEDLNTVRTVTFDDFKKAFARSQEKAAA
jgi:hypothetical protein